jgi:hypothetical protein
MTMIEDLSIHHTMVGELFPFIAGAAEQALYRLI